MSAPRSADRQVYTVRSGPDVRHELIAMREWRICAEEGTGRALLTSLNGEQVWEGPVFESPWSPDEPPGPSTGVHGLKRWCRRQLWEKGWLVGRETWAWGWVALSGLVEETPTGFRAEVAAIRHCRLGPFTLSLFDSRDAVRALVVELEERYRCPVKIGYPEWRVSRTMVPEAQP